LAYGFERYQGVREQNHAGVGWLGLWSGEAS
jgi:hypothetical protein